MFKRFMFAVAALFLVTTSVSAQTSACVRSSLSNNAVAATGLSDATVIQSAESQLRAAGWTVYSISDDGKGNWTCSGHVVFSIVTYALNNTSVYTFGLFLRGYEMADFRGTSTYGWAEAHSQSGMFNAVPTEAASTFNARVTEYLGDVISSWK